MESSATLQTNTAIARGPQANPLGSPSDYSELKSRASALQGWAIGVFVAGLVVFIAGVVLLIIGLADKSNGFEHAVVAGALVPPGVVSILAGIFFMALAKIMDVVRTVALAIRDIAIAPGHKL